jgi:hypothetical protein
MTITLNQDQREALFSALEEWLEMQEDNARFLFKCGELPQDPEPQLDHVRDILSQLC